MIFLLLKKLQKTKKLLQQTLQKREKKLFSKLNTSFVSDNKLFWKIIEPFFSNNGSHRGNIKLAEGDKLLQDDSEVAEELNNFFKEAVSTLDVNENSYLINLPQTLLKKAISKYQFHPSILLINDKIVN